MRRRARILEAQSDTILQQSSPHPHLTPHHPFPSSSTLGLPPLPRLHLREDAAFLVGADQQPGRDFFDRREAAAAVAAGGGQDADRGAGEIGSAGVPAACARRIRASTATVSTGVPPVRVNNGSPTKSSSTRIWWLIAEPVRPSSRAAF